MRLNADNSSCGASHYSLFGAMTSPEEAENWSTASGSTENAFTPLTFSALLSGAVAALQHTGRPAVGLSARLRVLRIKPVALPDRRSFAGRNGVCPHGAQREVRSTVQEEGRLCCSSVLLSALLKY